MSKRNSRLNCSERPPLLKMQNASVVRNGRRILDGLTLEIREGEHTAILGPNGAGKSSFIRLITREDYPLAQRQRHAAPVIIRARPVECL